MFNYIRCLLFHKTLHCPVAHNRPATYDACCWLYAQPTNWTKKLGSGVFPLGEATKERDSTKSQRDVIFHPFAGNSPLNQI